MMSEGLCGSAQIHFLTNRSHARGTAVGADGAKDRTTGPPRRSARLNKDDQGDDPATCGSLFRGALLRSHYGKLLTPVRQPWYSCVKIFH